MHGSRLLDQIPGELSRRLGSTHTVCMSSAQPVGRNHSDVTEPPPHPCQSCGACCASFRVQFYWREGERDHHPQVPPNTWQESHETQAAEPSPWRIMRGTGDKHHPRCTSLRGRIGAFVSCDVYSARPSPCRAFKASYENGYAHPRCDEARLRHGLKPLCKADWVAWHSAKQILAEP